MFKMSAETGGGKLTTGAVGVVVAQPAKASVAKLVAPSIMCRRVIINCMKIHPGNPAGCQFRSRGTKRRAQSAQASNRGGLNME